MSVTGYELWQKWMERKGGADALNFSLNLVYLALEAEGLRESAEREVA